MQKRYDFNYHFWSKKGNFSAVWGSYVGKPRQYICCLKKVEHLERQFGNVYYNITGNIFNCAQIPYQSLWQKLCLHIRWCMPSSLKMENMFLLSRNLSEILSRIGSFWVEIFIMQGTKRGVDTMGAILSLIAAAAYNNMLMMMSLEKVRASSNHDFFSLGCSFKRRGGMPTHIVIKVAMPRAPITTSVTRNTHCHMGVPSNNCSCGARGWIAKQLGPGAGSLNPAPCLFFGNPHPVQRQLKQSLLHTQLCYSHNSLLAQRMCHFWSSCKSWQGLGLQLHLHAL